jgi:hypothetical protein
MNYSRLFDRIVTSMALLVGMAVSSAWAVVPMATGNHASAHRLNPAIGYRPYWLHPAGCENNPDAWEIWIAYGYYDNGSPVITDWADAGYTAYTCGSYVPGTFAYSGAWSGCVTDTGDCPCIDSPCTVREGSP